MYYFWGWKLFDSEKKAKEVGLIMHIARHFGKLSFISFEASDVIGWGEAKQYYSF